MKYFTRKRSLAAMGETVNSSCRKVVTVRDDCGLWEVAIGMEKGVWISKIFRVRIESIC